MKFPERLKELRTENKLSQTELSKCLNGKVSQQAINLWENGLRIPKADAVVLLADFFKVSCDYLLGRTND